jgi:hypothetical protein
MGRLLCLMTYLMTIPGLNRGAPKAGSGTVWQSSPPGLAAYWTIGRTEQSKCSDVQ